MKKALTKIGGTIYYYKNGVRVEGAPDGITGDLSEIRGDLSGIRGNLDECEITDKDREKGITIDELISG